MSQHGMLVTCWPGYTSPAPGRQRVSSTCCDRRTLETRIMTGATEGVCRPLKSRAEQILVSEGNPVTLYRLTNLIRFYGATMSSVVRPDSGLSVSLAELTTLSRTQFLSMLCSSVSSHLARLEGGGDL